MLTENPKEAIVIIRKLAVEDLGMFERKSNYIRS